MLSILDRQEGQATVLSLLGSLEFASLPDFRTELHRVLTERDPRVLIIDLTNMRRIDSSGIGLLLNSRDIMKNGGGSLSLCGLQPNVRRVLDFLDLAKRFAIFPTVEDALKGSGS